MIGMSAMRLAHAGTEKMCRLSSTQRYIDDGIVAEKQSDRDYTITCVTLVVDGEKMDYVIDGHHSLAAATADGQTPERRYPAWAQREADHIGHLAYIDANRMDSDLYWTDTGNAIW